MDLYSSIMRYVRCWSFQPYGSSSILITDTRKSEMAKCIQCGATFVAKSERNVYCRDNHECTKSRYRDKNRRLKLQAINKFIKFTSNIASNEASSS
jgi:hypothetical protein